MRCMKWAGSIGEACSRKHPVGGPQDPDSGRRSNRQQAIGNSFFRDLYGLASSYLCIVALLFQKRSFAEFIYHCFKIKDCRTGITLGFQTRAMKQIFQTIPLTIPMLSLFGCSNGYPKKRNSNHMTVASSLPSTILYRLNSSLLSHVCVRR